MDRDEIIRMAHEAGANYDEDIWLMFDNELERFANLVAAEERKHCYDLIEMLVKAEREACARVAERFLLMHSGSEWDAVHCADAIRARGE